MKIEQIKYQQCMMHLQNAFDVLFHKTAELELARQEIAELKAQLKEIYEPSQPKDRVTEHPNLDKQPNGHREAETAGQVRPVAPSGV